MRCLRFLNQDQIPLKLRHNKVINVNANFGRGNHVANALNENIGGAFTSFFAGLEIFPILDSEVTQITGISPKLLSRYEKCGLISRSVINGQRPTAKISRFGFYDIFRFELIRQLHLNLFLGDAMLEENLDELLDTFALEIDDMLSYNQRRSKDEIDVLVVSYFKEREREWRQFWLLNGERLDPFQAGRVCVGIWLATFDASAQVILDFKASVRSDWR